MIGRRSNCVPLCDLTNCAISSRVKKVDRKKIIYEPRKTIKWDIPIQGGQAQWNTGRDNDNLIEIYQENYGILGRSNNPRQITQLQNVVRVATAGLNYSHIRT